MGGSTEMDPFTKSPKKPATPFGLPPVFFPIYYTLVLCLTGYAIAAVEPMKALMRMGEIQAQADNQEMELIDITNAGLVISILGAIFAGSFCDFFGPKITAVVGQLLFASGYACLFFSPTDSTIMHMIGSYLLGIAYSAIFNSHTSVAALFPANATLVLSILGCGPDVSLYIPVALANIAEWCGMQATMIGYMVLIGVILVLEIFLVPFNFFEAPKSDGDETLDSISDVEREETKEAQQGRSSGGFSHLSLTGQLLTPHFWIFAIFTGVNMFRKVHFTQLVGPIMIEIGEKTGSSYEIYITMFKNWLPLAVFPALLMGAFTNSCGVVAGLLLQNFWAVCLYFCCSFYYMKLQWASIVFFNLMSSYIFGSVFAFLANYYGLRTLGTLQGIQLLFAGTCSYLFKYWSRWLFRVDQPFPLVSANRILLVASCCMFVVPLYLICSPPGGTQAPESDPLLEYHNFDTCDDRRSTSAFVGSVAVYDRASMKVLKASVDSRASRRGVMT